MAQYQKILFSIERGIARITMNRPEKRNALDAEMVSEMKLALASTIPLKEVRVVTITGAGADFCSGADLAGILKSRDSGVLEIMDDARAMGELFIQMRHHPRPLVAVVRGRALAGGCGVATAADLVLASESAQFGYPEVKIGFIPAMVMAILRRSVPEKRAFELIAGGEVISSSTARDIGMVNRVYPDAEFDVSAEAYLTQLASRPASAVRLSKNLLYHLDGMTFDQAIEAGAQANAIARMTDEVKQGIEKFLHKS